MKNKHIKITHISERKTRERIVRNCSMSELMPIIEGKADKGATILTV